MTSTGSVVTPTDIDVKRQTSYGSADVAPVLMAAMLAERTAFFAAGVVNVYRRRELVARAKVVESAAQRGGRALGHRRADTTAEHYDRAEGLLVSEEFGARLAARRRAPVDLAL